MTQEAPGKFFRNGISLMKLVAMLPDEHAAVRRSRHNGGRNTSITRIAHQRRFPQLPAASPCSIGVNRAVRGEATACTTGPTATRSRYRAR